MSGCVIMLHGYTACGKTTSARAIQARLGELRVPCVLVQTNVIRNQREDRDSLVMNADYFLSDEHRDLVYGDVVQEMRLQLSAQRLPILDGTFNKKRWRTLVYLEAAAWSADVFVVKCVCGSDEVIKDRLRRRIYTFEDPHFIELDRTKQYSRATLDQYVEKSYSIYRVIRNQTEDIGEEEVEAYNLTMVTVDTGTGVACADFMEDWTGGLGEAVGKLARQRGLATDPQS